MDKATILQVEEKSVNMNNRRSGGWLARWDGVHNKLYYNDDKYGRKMEHKKTRKNGLTRLAKNSHRITTKRKSGTGTLYDH
uniref:Uncharacterized protein n=1 Tax=Romanomermis culicivorax TaxID=13658 RepID=A0A915L4H4_ROMCU